MSTRAFFVALLLPAIASAAQPDSSYHITAELVVDVSASMAKKHGDKPLFREAFDAALKSVESRGGLSSSVQLNWRTFGGVPQDDESSCEASQLIVPAGVTPGPVVRSAVPQLLAQGPRPLGNGLISAMADLPHEPGKQRAIILITSGLDTCGHDVCLAATELRNSDGLGNVHVILLNPEPAATSKLQCLGKVTAVRDSSELAKAVDDALDEILDPTDLTVSALEDGQEVPARVELYAVGDKQPIVQASTGVHLQVAGGVYDARVIKRTREDDDDAPRPADPSAEGLRQNVQLFPGSQLALRVPLGGKRGQIIANVLFNGKQAPSGTRIAVYHAGDTDIPVATGAPGDPVSVPPGRYDVRALIPGGTTGNIEVWKPEVSVTGGVTQTITLAAAQRRGSINVKVVSGGQPVDGAAFALLAPGSRGDGEPLYDAGVELPVPSGTYSVLAQLPTPVGNLRAIREGVQIAPNQPVELTIDVGPSALLTVQVAGHSAQDGIAIAVLRPGNLDPVGDIEAFSPQRFPPGTYDLRVEEIGGAPVQKAASHQRVELKPGQHRVITITPP